MKITRHNPPPPPELTMTFSQDEGRAIVMALKDAYYKYPRAVDRDKWLQWSQALNDELRQV